MNPSDEQLRRIVRAVLDELGAVHSATRYNVKLVVDGVYTAAEWTGMPMPPDAGSALTLRVPRGAFRERTYSPPFDILELRIELELDPMKPGGSKS